MDKLCEFFMDSMIAFCLPLVCSYYAISTNLFLNTACEEAKGLEKIGNTLLIPCHYLLQGQVATKKENGDWVFTDRFQYLESPYHPKTILSAAFAVPSFVLGITVKALAFLYADARKNYVSMQKARKSSHVVLNDPYYASIGIDLNRSGWLTSQGFSRRPGDENTMAMEKEGLKAVGKLLDEAGIPWWVDCGTLLGAYRYEGIIPWDNDIDIAVFLPDFENVRHALTRLDPKKFLVFDWSSRRIPKSYLKVYVRGSGTMIDIYHFKILPEEKKIHYLLSLAHGPFFPAWQKSEEQFTVPVAFDIVFPLQRALFDGIEINVPKEPKKYLERYYGENLSPAKIFNPRTNSYEKDPTHPYWQNSFAH